MNNSYYGSYRTRTFQQIWNSDDSFVEFLSGSGVPLKLKEENVRTLYFLLYARYGNSHISSSDENRFKYSVASTVFMYGPTWERRLEVQDALRKMTIEELKVGAKEIYNSAQNPNTAPTTDTLQELTFINSQNTSNRKRSTLDAYGELLAILETDVTKAFIDKFSNLFITIAAPDYPLLYEFNPEITGGFDDE